jgi:hypothetical protein
MGYPSAVHTGLLKYFHFPCQESTGIGVYAYVVSRFSFFTNYLPADDLLRRNEMVSKLLKITGLFILALAIAQPAFAAITLTLSSGSTTITIEDNDPLYDMNPAVGKIATDPFNGLPVGGWLLNVTFGLSQPPFGQPVGSLIYVDLTSNMTSSDAEDLLLTFETGPFVAESRPCQLESSIGGTLATGAEITARQYIQIGSGDSVQPVVIADHGTLGPGGAFSSEVVASGLLPEEFYVREEIILTAGAVGTTTSFDFESKVIIPEPFSVVIWSLLGLTGAGLTMVRRRKLNARSAWSEETRNAIHKAMKL